MAAATDIATERWRVAERLHGRPSDWLPKLWRGYSSRTPLALLDDVLARATRDDGVRALYTSAVRHGKTTLTMAGIVRHLATRPGEHVMLCGHSQDFIEGKSRSIRDAASRAGLRLRRDGSKLAHWELTNGASLIAAGVGAGGITGEGCSLLVCDDLFATREQAESAHERDRVDAWLSGTALTRLTPTGSAIISGARWHLDDVHARLAERGGWEYLAQPAIRDDGSALWPDGGWTLAALEAKRREIGEYDFASLYLCSPVPRDGALVRTAPLTFTRDDLADALSAGASMMDDVVAYVARRATWIREQQGRAAESVIGAMVLDALGDTFSRGVVWDPLRCPLALHLKSVIRSRLSHEPERAEDYPHVDIEEASEQEVNEALLSAGKTSPTKRLSKYVKEFTERLRVAAADDLAVLKLIDCYLDDITERAQICHASGMKPSAYHNAFRRLKRLAEKLPQELRAAALADLA